MPIKLSTELMKQLTVKSPEREYTDLEDHDLKNQASKPQVIRIMILDLTTISVGRMGT
ncbi:hypothetical protein G7B40_000905 [Aetokthonos hydrillicola Thurmond2011]|jgi:hypothetical protein|uniref:Uncharacterized protein n=1 Tax=Aetokthonos hydrillicola Thurmond2011 TaxID=2712845 RepID=A0AAP5I1L0_9CYAN|nr:hypothetical protein [Aetokthonos hydrillicola]MBO3463417.1 hypothetical protein [Aetokthonos hydrillicola CCALA 1050]MBW4588172.1 hypothetical protein [Aetokthonos hydrillicola CCALA 1050]MDR9893144.1 hypothetical protein [Aetokthonos hydrillicola Thurmond2011]